MRHSPKCCQNVGFGAVQKSATGFCFCAQTKFLRRARACAPSGRIAWKKLKNVHVPRTPQKRSCYKHVFMGLPVDSFCPFLADKVCPQKPSYRACLFVLLSYSRLRSTATARRGAAVKSAFFAKFCKFLAGSFSAVSKRNLARKYAFDSIFQALQDFHTFAPLQSQNFRKKFEIARCAHFSTAPNSTLY